MPFLSSLIQPSNLITADTPITLRNKTLADPVITVGGVTGGPRQGIVFDENGNLAFGSDDSISIPAGGTGRRPANPAVGELRFNTDTDKLEQYNGTSWIDIASGDIDADSLSIGSNLVIDSSGNLKDSNGNTVVDSLGNIFASGNTVIDSTGNYKSSAGHTVINSDGHIKDSSGNTVIHPDGDISAGGHTVINSDGHVKDASGNTIVHPDGTVDAHGEIRVNGNILTDGQSIRVPSVTTGQRPQAPVDGELIYNTDVQKFEVYSGVAQSFAEVGGGGGSRGFSYFIASKR